MIILDSIRNKIGYTLLDNKIKKDNIKHYSNSFQDAQSIGILYNVDNNVDMLSMEKMINFLCFFEKKIFLLYYLKNKKEYVKNYEYDLLSVNSFNNKNINFIFHPNSMIIQNFIKKEFDILISISFYSCLPINYITGRSNAKFRIGPYNKSNIKYLDLIFDLKKDKNIENFIKNFQYYFSL
ncbi:MAG: hypothetical protein IR527_01935 [Bacteroides sp.]|nr:MAG: hypothetical protein IR527_01935 [Bacteroides sp.]